MATKNRKPVLAEMSDKAEKKKGAAAPAKNFSAEKADSKSGEAERPTFVYQQIVSWPHIRNTEILDIYRAKEHKDYWQEIVQKYQKQIDHRIDQINDNKEHLHPSYKRLGYDYNGDKDSMNDYDIKRPTVREKVISMGFSFRIDRENVNALLAKAGYGYLYPRSVDDAAYIYLLDKNNSCSIPLDGRSLFRMSKSYIEIANLTLAAYWLKMVSKDDDERLDAIRRANENDRGHTITTRINAKLADVYDDDGWNRLIEENKDMLFMSPDFFCNRIILNEAMNMSGEERRQLVSYINIHLIQYIDDWINKPVEKSDEELKKNLAFHNGKMTLKKYLEANNITKSSTGAQWVSNWRKGTRMPSRPQLIVFGMSVGMTIKEINGLLKAAHMSPLYPRDIGEGLVMHILNIIQRENPELFKKSKKTLEQEDVVQISEDAFRREADYYTELLNSCDEEGHFESDQISGIVGEYIGRLGIDIHGNKLLAKLYAQGDEEDGNGR
jgi:hypothetical protein